MRSAAGCSSHRGRHTRDALARRVPARGAGAVDHRPAPTYHAGHQHRDIGAKAGRSSGGLPRGLGGSSMPMSLRPAARARAGGPRSFSLVLLAPARNASHCRRIRRGGCSGAGSTRSPISTSRRCRAAIARSRRRCAPLPARSEIRRAGNAGAGATGPRSRSIIAGARSRAIPRPSSDDPHLWGEWLGQVLSRRQGGLADPRGDARGQDRRGAVRRHDRRARPLLALCDARRGP